MSSVQSGEKTYTISSTIVHSLVSGVVLLVLGSSGTAIWSAVELRQAIDKLNSLPSPQLINERRENRREWNNRQDRRLDRIERAIYGPINPQSKNMSFDPGKPPEPEPAYAVLPAISSKRRDS